MTCLPSNMQCWMLTCAIAFFIYIPVWFCIVLWKILQCWRTCSYIRASKVDSGQCLTPFECRIFPPILKGSLLTLLALPNPKMLVKVTIYHFRFSCLVLTCIKAIIHIRPLSFCNHISPYYASFQIFHNKIFKLFLNQPGSFFTQARWNRVKSANV
jgi:hypothetical protein